MQRQIALNIAKDLKKKLVVLTGPRQSGKTTLSKAVCVDYDYFNYDDPAARLALQERNWDRRKDLVVFDELHKMRDWQTWIKGIYDVEGLPPGLLVTGSARMDLLRKSGDSLAGRFFTYRLHPFDVKEASAVFEPEEALHRILTVGGFPEPFLEADPVAYARWKKSHIDVILRYDLLDLTGLTDIVAIETLLELLRHRVGSPVSYANLAADLQKDPKTVKAWLQVLEDLYIIYPVRPWHRNIARSILKEPKYYFYDTAQVRGDNGCRLENAVACALRKELDFLSDTRGDECGLHYLRTRDGKELDFAVLRNGAVTHRIEVKWSDSGRSPAFDQFSEINPEAHSIQLIGQPCRSKTWPDGLIATNAARWLAELQLDT